MKKRMRYLVQGTVQGVGFRPFVFHAATRCGLSGFVCNSRDGVVIEVEGEESRIAHFMLTLRSAAPPRAEIRGVSACEVQPLHETSFHIVWSQALGQVSLCIAPDTATCPECLAELFEPGNRRYRYPFITCSVCGPRFSIVCELPYDRDHTAMACFPLCPQCAAEYENPADRRFHAETIACPICGPELMLYRSDGSRAEAPDVLAEARALLRRGTVLAIKGLGGYHLCVDACNDAAVQRLRLRKRREEKPFALMVKDIEHAEAVAELDDADRALLVSPERPIVLVKKKAEQPLSEAVAPGMATFGIMLPYTPLQHLLLQEDFLAVVMTSANKTDEPICIGNREALERLSGIADFFLIHNRDILVRCDDSVTMTVAGMPYILRRGRGFVPRSISLATSLPPVLALGPHLKATVCVVKQDQAFVSPHIGDMETPQARDFFHQTIALLQKITKCEPSIVACDLHPDYYSTRSAMELHEKQVISVQHHHAHVVSCMAENRIQGTVIGIAMDGTGYGADGNIWGGEFLVADATGYRRVGHLKYFMLPGGHRAVREPWRSAASLLRQIYGEHWQEQAAAVNLAPPTTDYGLIEKSMQQSINAPLTSSLGRLFDAAAALLGLRRCASFEGQAAMELEAAASRAGTPASLLPYEIAEEQGVLLLDMGPALRELFERFRRGDSCPPLAASFHYTLCHAFTAMAEALRARTGIGRVVLSGGCFQNKTLLEGCLRKMRAANFEVIIHCQVPPNDGGISLGQAVIAGTQALNLTGKIQSGTSMLQRTTKELLL